MMYCNYWNYYEDIPRYNDESRPCMILNRIFITHKLDVGFPASEKSKKSWKWLKFSPRKGKQFSFKYRYGAVVAGYISEELKKIKPRKTMESLGLALSYFQGTHQ